MSYSYAGDLERAMQYANEAVNHARTGFQDMSSVLQVVHKVRGDVFQRRGLHAEAIAAYKDALKSSDRQWTFFVEVSLANAYVGSGQIELASKAFENIGMPSNSVLRPIVKRGLGNLALTMGKPQEALQRFEEALKGLEGNDQDFQRVQVLEGIARTKLATGDRDGALRSYLAAVESAEQVRARFRSEEFKAGLFGEMRSVFDEATRLLAEAGDAEAAWSMSERGRARALLDLMRGRVQESAGRDALADPLGQSATIRDVQAGLSNGDALVQFHLLNKSTVAWVIRKDLVKVVQLSMGRAAIAGAVERFRDLIYERKGQSVQKAGLELYLALLEPLGLAEGKNLIIVPHDALHYLPFQALYNSKGFLIEQHAVSYAPSGSALARLISRQMISRPGTVIAIGNPDLGDPLLMLPAAQREVESIGRLYPESKVFVGRAATKQRVLEDAPGARLLHIAAHAQVDAVDPLFSRIRLAGTDKSKGDLEAHEIYRIDLSRAETVILSACDSGLGRVSNGDEIWGFTRSFLAAGSAALMVSLWPVADDSTERLMAVYYKARSGGVPRQRALREAQLALLKDDQFGAPYFWAPFNLVGDWR